MLYPEYHKKTFTQRRQNLLHSIKDPNPFLIILFNSPVYPQCSDAHYRHRTDSSFFYLTGLTEEDSAALLFFDGKKTRYELFVRPRDPAKEQWNGLRLGPDGAKKKLSPDEAFEITELNSRVDLWFKSLPKGSLPHIYSNFSSHEASFQKLRNITQSISSNIRLGEAESSAYIELLPYVRALRLIKDEHEISELRIAAKINMKAHLELMKELKPGMTEYQAQAILEKNYIYEGARGPGYDSILGSGPNAAILHYNENNCVMKAGEMLLADAGCEFRMYQSDITRTLPVDKTFTPLQRKLMDIVHEAKVAATAVCVEGRTLVDFHKTASLALIEGLKSLKLLKGNNEKILEKGEHRCYYPHGTGHWMGLDVHDPCPSWSEGKSIPFKAGMVLTVEPGLYFMHNDTSVPKEFRGLGVRIEDNLLIQPKGKAPENLTSELPSTWKEIESVKKTTQK
ncbi:MAG: aminopeptidase P family protein [Bdellovibrionota bacterium]